MTFLLWLIIFCAGIGAQLLILNNELLWGLLLYILVGTSAFALFQWKKSFQQELTLPSIPLTNHWNVWLIPIIIAVPLWGLSVGFIFKASNPANDFTEGFRYASISWILFLFTLLIACSKDLYLCFQNNRQQLWNPKIAYSLIGLCLFALCLGLYRLTTVPITVHGDEGMVGLHARMLLEGKFATFFSTSWYAIPQFFYFVPAVGLYLFGDSLFGLRMSTVIMGILTVIPFFVLCRMLWGYWTAIFASVLLISNHWFLHLMHSGVNYVQAAFFAITLLCFWFLSYKTQKMSYLFLSGITMGVALLSYQANHLLPFLWVASWAWVWVLRQINWKQLLINIAIPLILAVMCIAPLLTHLEMISQADNMFNNRAEGVVAFTEANMQHLNSVYQAGGDPGRIWLNQARRALLAPIAYADSSIQYDGERPMLDVLLSVLFMSAVVIACFRFYDICWSVPIWWVLGILIAGGMLTVDPPFFPRLSGLTAILFLIISGVFHQITNLQISHLQKKLFYTFIILVVIISAIINIRHYFIVYAYQISPQSIHYAQTEIAKYIMEQGKENQYYALEGNHFSIQSGTVQFLANEYDRQSVSQPPNDFPQPNQIFIIPPSRQNELGRLRNQYPNANFEIHRAPDGRVLFYTLRG